MTDMLKPEHKKLAEALVASGKFSDVDEVIEVALQGLKAQEQENAETPDWHIDLIRERVAQDEAGHSSPATVADILAMAHGDRA